MANIPETLTFRVYHEANHVSKQKDYLLYTTPNGTMRAAIRATEVSRTEIFWGFVWKHSNISW